MVALGLMEILVLLLIAFFLIGVPMVIIGLVLYTSKRERKASSYMNSEGLKNGVRPVERLEDSRL